MAKAKRTEPARHVCRWPMGYKGADLDYGQIFQLDGAANDEKLVRLGYVMQYDSSTHDAVICPGCGAEFIGHDAKIDHVRLRHREMTAAEEEELLERQEKKLETLSPLYLDKTIANQR